MEMKWNPIVNGDLSEVPREEDVLFTVHDEDTGEVYTTIGEASDYFIDERGYVVAGKGIPHPVYTESIKAWMEVPEPFKLPPDKCFKCDHGKLQQDEFSDNWFECELLQRNVPPNGKPEDCPVEKEVD